MSCILSIIQVVYPGHHQILSSLSASLLERTVLVSWSTTSSDDDHHRRYIASGQEYFVYSSGSTYSHWRIQHFSGSAFNSVGIQCLVYSSGALASIYRLCLMCLMFHILHHILNFILMLISSIIH